MIRCLIAADKFKGTHSSMEVAGLIAGALECSHPARFQCRCVAMADGGEGFAEAMVEGGEVTWHQASVRDALGRGTTAKWALRADGAAFMEMSEASGLTKIAHEERDPWRATTIGTGETMRDAILRGARRIFLGIGGSATNDGGCGMALAWGWKFLDALGSEVTELPSRLGDVVKLVAPVRIFPCPVLAACDVDISLLGMKGATRMFGPQKGIGDCDFARFEDRFEHLVRLVEGVIGPNELHLEPGSGAAGGLGYGLRVFCGAELISGFELCAKVQGLENAIRECDLVITGEGRLDEQSLTGKCSVGVAKMAREMGKRVVAVAGRVSQSARLELDKRFDLILETAQSAVSLEEVMGRSAHFVQEAVRGHADRIWALADVG